MFELIYLHDVFYIIFLRSNIFGEGYRKLLQFLRAIVVHVGLKYSF